MLNVLPFTDSTKKRHALGQFFTPNPIADFMASLFDAGRHAVDLLDAGAGTGALTAALVRRLCHERARPKRISVTAYEIDSDLIGALHETFADCRQACEHAGIAFSADVHNEDFIAAAVPMVRGDLFSAELPRYNSAIVNPPYRKIRSDSPARLLLRSVGIETSNLYTAFVALITKQLANRGELVAITPRSFCNGPYFKPFRLDFLDAMSLRRLHVFESRSAAFSGDDVLQENVIVHAVKGAPTPKRVIISGSSGESHASVTERRVDYRDIVSPADQARFIHVVVDGTYTTAKSTMKRMPGTLADLGLDVSTGRVVEFRAAPFLRQQPEEHTVPLIYPCHFNGGFIHWPKGGSRKPNAIVNDERTRDLLVPSGVYVLVKRITAKEERRRIVACIYDPERIHAPWVGFENHLNYFHAQGRGLPPNLAKGLALFLNSTMVDKYFRQFSGHTQVNATDLRALRYPHRTSLEQLGREIDDTTMPQEELDRRVSENSLTR